MQFFSFPQFCLPTHLKIFCLPLPRNLICTEKTSPATRHTRRLDASHLPQRGTIGGGGDAARCRGDPEMYPVGAAEGPGWLPPSGGAAGARWAKFWMRGRRRVVGCVDLPEKLIPDIFCVHQLHHTFHNAYVSGREFQQLVQERRKFSIFLSQHDDTCLYWKGLIGLFHRAIP